MNAVKTSYRCPVCRRNAWITRAGVEQHLTDDHSPAVLAAELLNRVYPPHPEPTSKPPAPLKAPEVKTCRKIPYPSESEALKALLSAWRKGGYRRCERRAYLCDRCSSWHLTKQPERTEQ